VLGAPFSRVNEELLGSSDPWQLAVEQYVAIGEINDYELETRALNALKTDQSNGSNVEIEGLVSDIESWFSHPSPIKPVYANLEIFESSQEHSDRLNALWVLAKQANAEHRDIFDQLVGQMEWVDLAGAIAFYFAKIADPTYLDQFVHYYPAFLDRDSVMSAILELANDGDRELLVLLLPLAEGHNFRNLARWFVQHPFPAATNQLRERVNGYYRENWHPAFELASLGDKGVLVWAIQEHQNGHEKWKADYIFATSTLAEADAYVMEILNGNDRARIMHLLEAQYHAGNPNMSIVLRVVEKFSDHPECYARVIGIVRWMSHNQVTGSDTLLLRLEVEWELSKSTKGVCYKLIR